MAGECAWLCLVVFFYLWTLDLSLAFRFALAWVPALQADIYWLGCLGFVS